MKNWKIELNAKIQNIYFKVNVYSNSLRISVEENVVFHEFIFLTFCLGIRQLVYLHFFNLNTICYVLFHSNHPN